jgi:hypothetical protein
MHVPVCDRQRPRLASGAAAGCDGVTGPLAWGAHDSAPRVASVTTNLEVRSVSRSYLNPFRQR